MEMDENEISPIEDKFNTISIDPEPKLNFNFNFNAKPYQPVESAELISSVKAEVISVPKITKRAEETEQNRAKVIAEARDSKESVSIVFIGHVDAGKSTLGGHLLVETGMVDKRTLEKYEREAKGLNRESWYYSWALDTNKDEREKGKTVEVARANFHTEAKDYILLDAPGHKAFVPNMITGVAQADVAILVISARINEFETGFLKGGQTREHAQIAKICGVKYLLVAINKMDDSTVEWSEERYNSILKVLLPFLETIGWKSSDVFSMPISGFIGHNIKNPIPAAMCSWYQNKPTLLEYLDSLPPININIESPPTILITDRYKEAGLVCAGKVISGCFTKNDSFTIMPTKTEVKIANIMTMDCEDKSIGKVGENINIRINNLNENDVQPGYVLCSPSALCSIGTVFEAQIIVIECKAILAIGFQAVIHLHNVVEEFTLEKIDKIMDKKKQKWIKTKQTFVVPDNICLVRLSLSKPQCMSTHIDNLQLSRFSLRDEGKSIAYGKVVKIIE